MKNKNEISSIILNYVYGDNVNFLNFEEYLNGLEKDKLNTIIDAYGILNDPDKTQKFIMKHVVHKDPFCYYSDKAEDALKK